jgi:hypothetical protein
MHVFFFTLRTLKCVSKWSSSGLSAVLAAGYMLCVCAMYTHTAEINERLCAYVSIVCRGQIGNNCRMCGSTHFRGSLTAYIRGADLHNHARACDFILIVSPLSALNMVNRCVWMFLTIIKKFKTRSSLKFLME